jgi:hypothetical protein
VKKICSHYFLFYFFHFSLVDLSELPFPHHLLANLRCTIYNFYIIHYNYTAQLKKMSNVFIYIYLENNKVWATDEPSGPFPSSPTSYLPFLLHANHMCVLFFFFAVGWSPFFFGDTVRWSQGKQMHNQDVCRASLPLSVLHFPSLIT